MNLSVRKRILIPLPRQGGLYYSDTSIDPLDFRDNFTIGFGLNSWGTDSNNIKVDDDYENVTENAIDWNNGNQQSKEAYLNQIRESLMIGKPVIICVKLNDSKHYVTVIGVEAGVAIKTATFDQLVIIDPGTN